MKDSIDAMDGTKAAVCNSVTPPFAVQIGQNCGLAVKKLACPMCALRSDLNWQQLKMKLTLCAEQSELKAETVPKIAVLL